MERNTRDSLRALAFALGLAAGLLGVVAHAGAPTSSFRVGLKLMDLCTVDSAGVMAAAVQGVPSRVDCTHPVPRRVLIAQETPTPEAVELGASEGPARVVTLVF
jgi:hypothetical protein